MAEPANSPKISQDDVTNIKDHLAIYNFIILAILTCIAIVAYLKVDPPVLRNLTYTACAGGIGGIIYNMRNFSTHSPKDVLDWRVWYYLFPITCIFFGVFSFMLVAGGLLVLSGNAGDTNKEIAQTVYFYIAVAFLAGFSTEQFIAKIQDISNTIFSNASPAAPPEVTGVSPSTGTTGGDVQVIVTGKGFTGATGVNFGDIAANGYTVNSDSVITAKSPPNKAGEVHVTITTSVGTSAVSDNSKFTYQEKSEA